MNIGIIGAGNISGIYLENASRFGLRVVAVADLDLARARAKADEYGVPEALSPEHLLAREDIELAVNLTVPAAHGSVALAALKAGKHVYNEKPLAVSLAEARATLDLAASQNLRVGCAPDTFLGAGLQTCRELLDGGAVGTPIAATAFFMSVGPEIWHPDPAFFFQEGAGPLFDMGPYYLTALVSLFGPVARVLASAKTSRTEREVGSGPKAGQRFGVQTPTHVSGVLEFASGPTASLIMSFEAVGGGAPNLEIYGSGGALTLPDPNTFGGPVKARDASGPWGVGEWEERAVTRPFAENSRGLGVADMARAIAEERPHLASGELAYHALEVMHATLRAAREQRPVSIESAPERPAPLNFELTSA